MHLCIADTVLACFYRYPESLSIYALWALSCISMAQFIDYYEAHANLIFFTIEVIVPNHGKGLTWVLKSFRS